jgi:hypothetical protein
MQNHPKPTDISVVMAPNGHVLIFQGGFYQQALFIEREHVPRFLLIPDQTPVLIVPPFAALALECHTSMADIESMNLDRDLALGPEFRLVIKSKKGVRIGYFSDHEAPLNPQWLAEKRINVAITPMTVVTVHMDGEVAAVATVASIPNPELPNYKSRFAVDPLLIRNAVNEAVIKSRKSFNYEN